MKKYFFVIFLFFLGFSFLLPQKLLANGNGGEGPSSVSIEQRLVITPSNPIPAGQQATITITATSTDPQILLIDLFIDRQLYADGFDCTNGTNQGQTSCVAIFQFQPNDTRQYIVSGEIFAKGDKRVAIPETILTIGNLPAPAPNAQKPIIASISPSSGNPNSEITIIGQNFCPDYSTLPTILFTYPDNQKLSAYTDSNNSTCTRLKINVPAKDVAANTTVKVSVLASNSTESDGQDFVVNAYVRPSSCRCEPETPGGTSYCSNECNLTSRTPCPNGIAECNPTTPNPNPPAPTTSPGGGSTYQGYERGKCTTTLTISNPMTYCAKADQDGKCISGNTIAYDGLVPCGKCVILNPSLDSNGKPVLTNGTLSGSAKYIDCQFCHFLVMFKGIVDWIVSLLVPVLAALMLIIAGVSFFIGGNNPSMIINAKKTIWAVVIGVAIIYGAWIIVNTFLTFPGFVNLDVNGLDLRKWFQVNCPIKLP